MRILISSRWLGVFVVFLMVVAVFPVAAGGGTERFDSFPVPQDTPLHSVSEGMVFGIPEYALDAPGLSEVTPEFFQTYWADNEVTHGPLKDQDPITRLRVFYWGRVKHWDFPHIIIQEDFQIEHRVCSLYLLIMDDAGKLLSTQRIAFFEPFMGRRIVQSVKVIDQILELSYRGEREDGVVEKKMRYRVYPEGRQEELPVPGYGLVPQPVFPSAGLSEGFLSKNEVHQPLPQLYVVGWSEDNLIAWGADYYDHFVGALFVEWTIQDLATNEVLWSYRTSEAEALRLSAGLSEEEARSPGNIQHYFDELLKRNRSVFIENRILAHPVDGLRSFPRESANQPSVSIGIDVQKGRNPLFGIEAIRHVGLFLELGDEVITARRRFYSENDIERPYLDIAASGYLLSPYNQRVMAVVTAWAARAWEGPPNDLFLRIQGAELR